MGNSQGKNNGRMEGCVCEWGNKQADDTSTVEGVR